MDTSGPRVTPSRPNYWNGTRSHPDNTFTNQQIAVIRDKKGLMEANRRRYGLPATYDVKLTTAASTEHPRGRQIKVTCPVLSGSRDRTRLNVIAPNGMEAWVQWDK